MNEKSQSIAVSNLINSSITSELIPKLAELGILSSQDVYDIYDRALESIEHVQATSEDDSVRDVCKSARSVIENALKSTQSEK